MSARVVDAFEGASGVPFVVGTVEFFLPIAANVADEIAAVSSVVKEYANPLMCGAVDPEDASMGLSALREELKAAGIDTVIAEIESQYADWKAAQE